MTNLFHMAESKRHALQDYQKTDGVRLVAPPDSSYMMKSKKMSLGKCVRRCSRNRKLPFTCRYGGLSGSVNAVNLLEFMNTQEACSGYTGNHLQWDLRSVCGFDQGRTFMSR